MMLPKGDEAVSKVVTYLSPRMLEPQDIHVQSILLMTLVLEMERYFDKNPFCGGSKGVLSDGEEVVVIRERVVVILDFDVQQIPMRESTQWKKQTLVFGGWLIHSSVRWWLWLALHRDIDANPSKQEVGYRLRLGINKVCVRLRERLGKHRDRDDLE